MKNQFGKKVVPIPIEVDLLLEIQRLSENTNEIYEDQPAEHFVHNILNMERLRLQKLQKPVEPTYEQVKVKFLEFVQSFLSDNEIMDKHHLVMEQLTAGVKAFNINTTNTQTINLKKGI
ncbi:hypothetical protein [Niallia sp. 03133]|uniref:hypothetical protein n=1 Tax=Niallia sp. 03133 TaxID=3458060 RepID=UPI004043963A